VMQSSCRSTWQFASLLEEGQWGRITTVAQTIYDVLDEHRAAATSEADKGSKFERLFKAYLTTDSLFADQFDAVWMWNGWPDREGKHDTGIGLVALNKITGGRVAIQCKFFDPTSTINKPDIDSFLSATSTRGFEPRDCGSNGVSGLTRRA
jgi:predicted helicase